MKEDNKIKLKRCGILGVMALVTGSFGPILGLESNLMRFDSVRIQDTSFKAYLEKGNEQSGENLGTYVFALWTYPGARLGVAIHNYGLPENFER